MLNFLVIIILFFITDNSMWIFIWMKRFDCNRFYHINKMNEFIDTGVGNIKVYIGLVIHPIYVYFASKFEKDGQWLFITNSKLDDFNRIHFIHQLLSPNRIKCVKMASDLFEDLCQIPLTSAGNISMPLNSTWKECKEPPKLSNKFNMSSLWFKDCNFQLLTCSSHSFRLN